MTPLHEKRLIDFLRFGNMSHETREAVTAAMRAVEDQRAVLSAVVSHWNEFGPEHGFEETIHRAERLLRPEQ